jgi:predicted GNAT family acetyltransferase
MIRLLTENDREKVLQYLYKELNFNIFSIGDIEAFGFDTNFQRIYGEFDKKGNYKSVFLRYREHAIYYSHKTRFNKAYLTIFENDKFEFISCKTKLMELIFPYLGNGERQHMYFCHAKEIKINMDYDKSRIKKITTKEECGRLYDLLSQIKEFGIHKKSRDYFIDSKYQSLQMGTTLYIEEDNKIVSTVATTADTTKNAMVVAVATHQDYRNKGYATWLLLELMKMYLRGLNKELCLFYNNPKAGKIYLKLGFEYIGTWDMFTKNKG